MKGKSIYAAALDSELHHHDSLENFCKQFDSIAQAFEWMQKEHTEEEIIDMLSNLGFNIKTKKSMPPEPKSEEEPEKDDWFHNHFIKHKQLMDQKEAAAYLGTTVGTLNSWRHYSKDKIPFVRWGNRIRYRKEDLDEWIKTHVVDVDNNETFICKAG